MLSKEYLKFREMLAKLPPPGQLPPDGMPDGLLFPGSDRPIPDNVTVTKNVIGGVPAEFAKCKGAPKGKLLVYVHGGGFERTPPGKQLNIPFVATLSELSGMDCIAPDYRLMPDYFFPDTINDCVAFYQDLLAQGYHSTDIALVGESAGGNLVLAMWLWMKAYGVSKPAAIASLSAAVDLSGSEAHIGTRLAKGADLHAPLLSPRYGDFRGLHKVFMQYGSQDLEANLLPAGRELIEEMKAQGVNVVFDFWPDMGHAFACDVGLYPEANEACLRAVNYLKCELGLL